MKHTNEDDVWNMTNTCVQIQGVNKPDLQDKIVALKEAVIHHNPGLVDKQRYDIIHLS
jgi:hypothetical protein